MPEYTNYMKLLIDAEMFRHAPGPFKVDEDVCTAVDKALYYCTPQTAAYLRDFLSVGDLQQVAFHYTVQPETVSRHYWRVVNLLRQDSPMRDMVYNRLYMFSG